MIESLFKSFEPVPVKAWKQKIQVDLKGADYNNTLIWKTNEGIDVKPFYAKEDRTHQVIPTSFEGYKVCQSVFIDDPFIANQIARKALEKGAEAIQFKANKSFHIENVLQNIPTGITLYFALDFLEIDFVSDLANKTQDYTVYFQIDPVGHLAENGNWYTNLTSDFSALMKLTDQVPNSVFVSSDLYQNAGATIPQQLAYTLAHAYEYLHYLGTENARNIHFNVSVGGNYFFEIAKLRALRLLWNTILEDRNINEVEPHIFTQPSIRNKGIYDYNVNMLRTTSECMSAILGGSNTVANIPYDVMYHKSNEFGERISRNQLLVLNEESGFKNAKDIVDGTYYIESLTEQLAAKALVIFKQIESAGGFISQLHSGIIQRKINENHVVEVAAFNEGKLKLLGTNYQPNPDDRMKANLELYPFAKKRNTKTLIKPIIRRRIAEEFEKERLDQENE